MIMFFEEKNFLSPQNMFHFDVIENEGQKMKPIRIHKQRLGGYFGF